MTESEAIKELQENIDLPFGSNVSKEAAKIAMQALEKQIPKKNKIEKWIYTKCDCGYELSKHQGDGYYVVPYENKTKYCPNCGQRLDWSEKNEEIN